MAGRLLAELHQAEVDDEHERAERRKKLEKALNAASNSAMLGRLSGSGASVYGNGGFGGLTGRGTGTIARAGRGGGGVVGGIGGVALGKRTTKRSQKLLSLTGPLSRTRVRLSLRYSYAVELCQRTGNAWATVELVIEKGAVTRSRVISSSPTSSKFHKCVEKRLDRLHFAVKPKRTVVRATLRITRPARHKP